MPLERKSLPFHLTEIKATEGGGWEVAGYASTFGGTPDSYSDVVAKGAFTKSIAKRKTKLLYQHDPGEPIGKQLDLFEDDKGLFGRWSILPIDTGIKAHQLLAAELIDSLSIGFQTVDAEYREDGVRVLKEVELFEVSLVTFPANEGAVVTSFKSGIRTDIPIHQLLLNAADYLEVATREAEAFAERRAADKGRDLNEKQREAAQRLRERAEACGVMLASFVAPPDAEAKAGDLSALEELNLWESEIELRRLRRKYTSLPALKEA